MITEPPGLDLRELRPPLLAPASALIALGFSASPVRGEMGHQLFGRVEPDGLMQTWRVQPFGFSRSAGCSVDVTGVWSGQPHTITLLRSRWPAVWRALRRRSMQGFQEALARSHVLVHGSDADVARALSATDDVAEAIRGVFVDENVRRVHLGGGALRLETALRAGASDVTVKRTVECVSALARAFNTHQDVRPMSRQALSMLHARGAVGGSPVAIPVRTTDVKR